MFYSVAEMRKVLAVGPFKVIKLFVLMGLNAIFEVLGITSVFPLLQAATNGNFTIDVSPYFHVSLTLEKVSFFVASVFIIRFFVNFFYVTYQSNFLNSLIRDTSVRIYRIFAEQPISGLDELRVADATRITTGSINQIVMGIFLPLLTILLEVVTIIMLVVTAAMTIGVYNISFITGVILLFLGLFRLLSKLHNGIGRIKRKADGDRVALILDLFGLRREIRVFHLVDYFVERFSTISEKSKIASVRQAALGTLPRSVLELILILSLCIFFMATNSTDVILSAIPMIGLIFLMSLRCIPSVTKLTTALSSIEFSKSFLKEVADVMQRYNSVTSITPTNDRVPNLNAKKGEISALYFENFTVDIFGMRKYVLNASLEAGTWTCIRGKSGAGKSTVIDTMVGIRPAHSGVIWVVDENGHRYESKVLHNDLNIALVPQAVYLTEDSIEWNIYLGRGNLSPPINSFIEELDIGGLLISKKKEFNISGENHSREDLVSGGQRLRIGMLRAVVEDPHVIILDETMSGLDLQNRVILYNQLNARFPRAVKIIITHYVTDEINFDNIIDLHS